MRGMRREVHTRRTAAAGGKDRGSAHLGAGGLILKIRHRIYYLEQLAADLYAATVGLGLGDVQLFPGLQFF